MADNTHQYRELGETSSTGILLVRRQLIAPSGSVAVVTDATLTGDGQAATPLHVVPAGVQHDASLSGDGVATPLSLVGSPLVTGQFATNGNGVKLKTVSGVLATCEVLAFSGDPNGTVTAEQGSILMDVATPAFWKNTTGAAVWSRIDPATLNAGTHGVYGDGSDGDVVIAGATTLVRDMFYRNLTVNVGVTLKTGSFRIHVSGLLTLNGEISSAGNPGNTGPANGVGGVAVSNGSLPATHSGGNGAQGGNGNAGATGGADCPRGIGNGGAGGGSGQGVGPNGGAGGVVTTAAANLGDLRDFPAGVVVRWPSAPGNTITLGGGGGGGGSDTAGFFGGGGGASGGWLVLCAKTWTGGGTLRADGGAGGTAAGQAHNEGGGGGGAGGVVCVVTTQSTIPATSVAGGAPGGPNGTGFPGGGGANGFVLSFAASL